MEWYSMTEISPITYAVEKTAEPLIHAFVDSDLQSLILKAASAVPPDKHLMIVPFVDNNVGRFATAYRFNDKVSAIGVLEHTWDTKENRFEIGAVITPF
jgi:hypothetical protein